MLVDLVSEVYHYLDFNKKRVEEDQTKGKELDLIQVQRSRLAIFKNDSIAPFLLSIINNQVPLLHQLDHASHLQLKASIFKVVIKMIKQLDFSAPMQESLEPTAMHFIEESARSQTPIVLDSDHNLLLVIYSIKFMRKHFSNC